MVVGVLVVATVAAMVALWPRAELPVAQEDPVPLLDGRILAVDVFEGDPDPLSGGDPTRVRLSVELLDGPRAGRSVRIEAPAAGMPDFDVGDDVKLSASPGSDGSPTYAVADFQRLDALAWLAGLFVVAVVAVGGWRGARSLVGLALSLAVITQFVVPAILAGEGPFGVALTGAMAVMIVTLYLAHGVTQQTTSAVVGTAFALAVTVGLGVLFIDVAQLTGFASEEAAFARIAVSDLDLRGLVLAGLIIAALGVLDDVTVAQAATVFALHDTDPTQSWRQVFTAAMRVGRDHIASTVNTLFLAYAGASIALLVLFATGGLPVVEILNSEVVAEELTKLLVGSVGLISAVPFTTALATTVAVRRPPGAQGHPPGARSAPPRPEQPSTVAATGTPAPPAVDPAAFLVDRSEPIDDAEDLAYEAWIRYVREGGREPVRPPGLRDEDEPPPGGSP